MIIFGVARRFRDVGPPSLPPPIPRASAPRGTRRRRGLLGDSGDAPRRRRRHGRGVFFFRRGDVSASSGFGVVLRRRQTRRRGELRAVRVLHPVRREHCAVGLDQRAHALVHAELAPRHRGFTQRTPLFVLDAAATYLLPMVPILLASGLLFGVIAMLFMLALFKSAEIAAKTGFPPLSLALMAAVICGSVAIFVPEILGSGVTEINMKTSKFLSEALKRTVRLEGVEKRKNQEKKF